MNVATLEECRQICVADPGNCQIFSYATAESQPVDERFICYLWHPDNNQWKAPKNQAEFLLGVPFGCYDANDFGF